MRDVFYTKMEIQLKFVTNCRGENDMEFNWLNKSEMEVEENKIKIYAPKESDFFCQ